METDSQVIVFNDKPVLDVIINGYKSLCSTDAKQPRRCLVKLVITAQQ